MHICDAYEIRTVLMKDLMPAVAEITKEIDHRPFETRDEKEQTNDSNIDYTNRSHGGVFTHKSRSCFWPNRKAGTTEVAHHLCRRDEGSEGHRKAHIPGVPVRSLN